jgi:hypothetical protein
MEGSSQAQRDVVVDEVDSESERKGKKKAQGLDSGRFRLGENRTFCHTQFNITNKNKPGLGESAGTIEILSNFPWISAWAALFFSHLISLSAETKDLANRWLSDGMHVVRWHSYGWPGSHTLSGQDFGRWNVKAIFGGR